MILKLFLFWRLGLFLLVILAGFTVAKTTGSQISPFYSWAGWDGGHFLAIAKNGYITLEDYAFFPLFPLVVKISSFLFFGNLTLAGLVVSHLCAVAFLYIFYNLVKKHTGRSVATATILTFILFPTSFFTVALYSESLFLLFVAFSFYFLSKKNYLYASIFTILASLTRLVGIALVIAIIYSYLESKKFKIKNLGKSFWQVLISPLGFIFYLFYLYLTTGDFLYFLKAQQFFWQRSIINPIATISAYVGEIVTLHPRPLFHYFDLLITVLFFLVLVLGRRKIPSSWWLFSVLVILIPASTTSLVSMSRFALASLGSFVIIGKFLEEKPYLKMPLWALSLFIQALLVVRFASGIWTA